MVIAASRTAGIQHCLRGVTRVKEHVRVDGGEPFLRE
jgi:hypothetical protein